MTRLFESWEEFNFLIWERILSDKVYVTTGQKYFGNDRQI